MTGSEKNEGEKARAGFAGIVLLLRQLAYQLIEHDNAMEARGIIDGIEALQAKTSGNLDEGESRFLEEILFELRMAAVKGPGGSEKEGDEAAGEKASGEDRAKAGESSPTSAPTGEDAERPPEPAGE